MPERRSFLRSVVAATLAASAGSSQASPLPQPFPAQLENALAKSLNDPETAHKLAPILLDIGFTWNAPAKPASVFRSIVAYSFGNRPALPGAPRPDPGPTNQALAEACLAAQRASHAAVIYAQWEIASFLEGHAVKIVAINPVLQPDHTVKYLSTDGVAEAVITLAGGPTQLGPVCVIGHHDHAKRCVETSRARGMDAWAMEGLKLPVSYDPESDQPWTRDRETYLIHDMLAQLAQIRAARLASLYHA